MDYGRRKHHENRLVILVESVQHLFQLLLSVLYAAQVIIENIAACVRNTLVENVTFAVICLADFIRTVILICHTEIEIRCFVLMLFVICDNIREKHAVRGNIVVINVLEMIFCKEITVKTEVFIDVKAVIEPFIAWVRALCHIAVVTEIVDIGP